MSTAELDAGVAFVDLVRFTALTDVHGDVVGANAAESLEGAARRRAGARLEVVKTMGDGVLLSAPTARDILDGAAAIVEDVHEIGLEARGGVHFGPVIVRHGDLFGSTVNLASRLAGAAPVGQLRVTRPVAVASAATVLAVGPGDVRHVKGFREPVETFVIDPCRHDEPWMLDPVCGMRLNATTAVRSAANLPTVGFCSLRCLSLFESDPEAYRGADA